VGARLLGEALEGDLLLRVQDREREDLAEDLDQLDDLVRVARADAPIEGQDADLPVARA
jgi:hypothetical protein